MKKFITLGLITAGLLFGFANIANAQSYKNWLYQRR